MAENTLLETLQAALEREGIVPDNATQLVSRLLRLVRDRDDARPTPSAIVSDNAPLTDSIEQQMTTSTVGCDNAAPISRRDSLSDTLANFFTVDDGERWKLCGWFALKGFRLRLSRGKPWAHALFGIQVPVKIIYPL